MTLNSSGPISLAGTTTGQSIELELLGNGTTTISLNDSNVRTLLAVPSGQISLSNAYGKSNRVTINITISTNTRGYNSIWGSAGGSYIAGKTDLTFTNNAVIGSNGAGSYALYTGGASSGDTLTIVNNGYIAGYGGGSGTGGSSSGGNYLGGPGQSGGPGLYIQWPVNINNGSGYIYSGGGGGGGGDGWDSGSGGAGGNGGGDGGGGGTGYLTAGQPGENATDNTTTIFAYGGAGGALGNNGNVGQDGYPAAAGGGGGGGGASGGHGGVRSCGGGAGGGHGVAIASNGYSINWISGSGRVYGGIS